jgi:hypothetical protein
MKRSSLLALLFLGAVVTLVSAQNAGTKPAWAEPMRMVHARFTGTPGTFACFGDSITVTMAFWSPLAYQQPKNLPADMARSLTLVKETMKPDCWSKWKGPAFGSNGSMTIRWAHDNIDAWLKKLNPEVALIMFGTNDLGQVAIEEYDKKTRAVVDRCLQNGTVVILTTIPPRSGRLEQSSKYAAVVRKIAGDKQVPLIDYFAEITKRRPDDWDGSLPKFKGAADGYQVPTLIAGDGVHPSNPRKFQDFSEESLRSNGYLLRNYLTLMGYADVIRNVLAPPK